METKTDSQTESIWIRQLYEEFRQITYLYRVTLKTPVIRLANWKGRWGEWDPMTRTITMSSYLIEHFRWDTVLEIFKHEIAHQIVTELFHQDEIHGDHFHKACRQLGVAFWARKAETDLTSHDLANSEKPERPQSRIFDRIQKLLQLANSSNPHEASSAMKKVQELHLKYNLEMHTTHFPSAYSHRLLFYRRKRLSRHHYFLASILQDYFFVRVVHSWLYDASERDSRKTLEIFGKHENVELAEYVFYFLLQQVQSLWESYSEKSTPGDREAYCLGVLTGFRQQLEAQQQSFTVDSREATTFSLRLLKDDPQTEKLVHERFPRLHSISTGTRRYSQSVFEEGKSSGAKIVLRKTMYESSKSQKKLPASR